jgi:AbrB family looped-hinge helix DNA binding protein
MRTTIDGAGRVVVPKAIRERLGLSGGAQVDVDEHDGAVHIRPVAAGVEVVDTPEGPVASSPAPGPPLTDDEVRRALERGRG